MAKLKYKDENGFWQELPVGTNVVANPMITGTEAELTGLQVGNTKYKSGGGGGGGKIYRHEVIISNMSSGYLHCIIINNIKTEFTASDLNDLFFKKVISASVDVISAHKTYTVKVITVTSTGISATYYASYPFSDTVSLSFPQDSSFTDTVIEI